jgi:hypothetical protein
VRFSAQQIPDGAGPAFATLTKITPTLPGCHMGVWGSIEEPGRRKEGIHGTPWVGANTIAEG